MCSTLLCSATVHVKQDPGPCMFPLVIFAMCFIDILKEEADLTKEKNTFAIGTAPANVI